MLELCAAERAAAEALAGMGETWDEILRDVVYEHGSGRQRDYEERVEWLARRCVAAESRLARLVEAAKGAFEGDMDGLSVVLRELEESDGK